MQKRFTKQASLLGSVLLMAAALCFAQTTDSAQTGKAKSHTARHTKTVSGCLQKGDEADEYSITDNGKTYGLRSSKVDLSKHVGHQVSVTGTLRPEREENEANEKKENEAAEKNEQKEAGDIRVSSLKMIKDSCQ
jgi:hypothetical protein